MQTAEHPIHLSVCCLVPDAALSKVESEAGVGGDGGWGVGGAVMCI